MKLTGLAKELFEKWFTENVKDNLPNYKPEDWADDNETVFGETEANAQLIADAFNVTNETGLTPRELQKSHAELLDALEGICNHWDRGNFSRDLDLWKAMSKAINNAKP